MGTYFRIGYRLKIIYTPSAWSSLGLVEKISLERVFGQTGELCDVIDEVF